MVGTDVGCVVELGPPPTPHGQTDRLEISGVSGLSILMFTEKVTSVYLIRVMNVIE